VDELNGLNTHEELENWRIAYLGRRGRLTLLLRGLYNYSRVNRVNRPVSGPVAGSQSNGQLSSPAEPGIPNVAHGPNVPDDCPQRQEKSLVWPLGTTPAMASAALGFTASSGDLTPTSLIPSYLISANDLSMRHQ